jgi:hypothetical protein
LHVLRLHQRLQLAFVLLLLIYVFAFDFRSPGRPRPWEGLVKAALAPGCKASFTEAKVCF